MLKLSGVTHIYPGGTVALDDASLEVGTGMFGLLGPNGAGKSTLMRCIATLQRPSRGSISFDEIDVLREPERLRGALGYLPQDFGVYPRVSALELLDHLAVLKGIGGSGERREIVQALLSQMNLWDVRKRPVAGFSGGMRQRFGIAQALIGAPRLLVVDEPTAGLDPLERNRFHDLLADIGQNIVVILSTHIVEDVADLCSQMAIIAQGRIVETGSPRALLDRLRGRVWKRAIERSQLSEYQQQMNVIASRLAAGQTWIHVLSDDSPGPDFEPAGASLEDVYFSALAAGPRARGSAA